MTFLSVVIVLLLVQWWGSGGPLQWDKWFYSWIDWLQARGDQQVPAWLLAFLAIAVPGVTMVLLVALVTAFGSVLWLFLINVPVLLYSLGRGRFKVAVEEYLQAVQNDDSVKAAHLLDEYNLDPALRADERGHDWTALHREALRVFCYRGFERMFAVLFWFLLLGAAGAFIYRLLVLYWARLLDSNHPCTAHMTRWLTWVEWPAARLMGLTWALVGNFEFCMRQWRDKWWKAKATPVFLVASLRGALGASDHSEPAEDEDSALHAPYVEPAYSLKLVEHLLPMFSRALWAWAFLIAAITLLR
ncbi:MAG TPA: regulatory signaling modulator protein AmpE [Cellvibrionaceae bacterium]